MLPFLRSEIESTAERRLYQALQEQLSDEFTVFHQVSWQVCKPSSGAKDGETDFVIVHPDLGILVLEVKGGGIRYDGSADRWYSNDNLIKDPFRQACDSKHNLLKLLKEQSHWHQRWIQIGYAVAFPDIVVNGRLLPNAPRDIILDSTQLSDLSSWVSAVLNYWRNQSKIQGNLEAIDIQELVKFFKPTVNLKTQLSREIADEKQQFIELSEKQLRLLDFLAQHRQVAISGCAGSGKTLLALEKAHRLSQQGFRVLLTCYGKGLAKSLRERLPKAKNLHIYNFHALCEKLAHQAGQAPNKDQDPEVLYNEIYPKLLVWAANKLNWRVDAVIVDEGQDFRQNWWVALQGLLNDPENGIFYFFYDDNQNIFGRNWQPPLKQAPFTLTENWRNTQQIHSHALQFYNGQHTTTALGPEGRAVKVVDYTTNTQLKDNLSRLLHHLVVEECIPAQDIAILTTTRKQTLQNQLMGQFRIKANPDSHSNEILCNTIHYFKGLESPVVILVETELKSVSHLKNLLYVGTSRARHHLIILRPDAPF